MAILWQSSLVPFIDLNGNPYSGAKAYFFDASTTTPRVVYTDSGLSIPHDHPVVANSAGMFPPIFLTTGDYHLRITTSTDVTIWDVDGISPPIAAIPPPPSGDTPLELLARTGDLKGRYDNGTHSGWVRANGRTVGSVSSGATERANADCENLFLWLWTIDATLAVSGGRGGSAAGDWAANKAIDLPDFRGRAAVGMASMGNSDAGRISATFVDGGENANILGAVGGTDGITLIAANMPAHSHTGTTSTHAGHTHTSSYPTLTAAGGPSGFTISGVNGTDSTPTTNSGGAHSHTFTTSSAGSGTEHKNLQPSMFVNIYVKL